MPNPDAAPKPKLTVEYVVDWMMWKASTGDATQGWGATPEEALASLTMRGDTGGPIELRYDDAASVWVAQRGGLEATAPSAAQAVRELILRG